jgi:hypothetical protein
MRTFLIVWTPKIYISPKEDVNFKIIFSTCKKLHCTSAAGDYKVETHTKTNKT